MQIPTTWPSGLRKDSQKLGQFILSWYQENRLEYPWRVNQDPYRVWLSEVMLQQTLVAAVIPIYESFLRKYPDIFAVAAAEEDHLKQAVAGLGYYRRFRLFHQAAKTLVAGSDGGKQISWPQTYEAWLALPGVGPYTAAAVSSIVLGSPQGVVDGNVERVFCRLADFRVPPNLPALKKLFKDVVQQLLPPAAPGDFNQGIMELGQKVCRQTKPLCEVCPLKGSCLALARQSQHLAPQKKIKPQPLSLQMTALVVKSGNKIGLWRRPSSRFLAGLAGFPLGMPGSEMASPPNIGNLANQGTIIGQFKHAITNHKITCQVQLITTRRSWQHPDWQWLPQSEVPANLVSSLDRKAWRLVTKHGSPKL